VLDVGQQQLLVLLLVREAEFDQRRVQRIREQRRHLLVDVRAPIADFGDARARQHPARWTRMARSRAFVIGVEEIAVGWVVDVVGVVERHEDEILEEPGHMRAMPFGRADIGHRLDGLVFGRESRRERLGSGPDG